MTSPARAAGYRRLAAGPLALRFRPRAAAISAALLLVLMAAGLFALASGSLPITLAEVLAALARSGARADVAHVVSEIRLPRVIMALLAGAALGLSGAAMQALTRNGLADPGLVGVKEGASVAVLALILAFPAVDAAWRPPVGMAGGLAVAFVVTMLARDLSGVRFVLVGIGVSWLLAAGLLVFITTADINDVETALVWLAGSLHAADWALIPALAFWSGLGTLVLIATARAADAALLGDGVAKGLGVRLKTMKALGLAAPVLMTAAAVSCVGSLGFVGLMAPHMARFLVGGGQAAVLTASALLGAALVLAADTAGRLLFAPLQIPAGVVMTLAGVPLFLLLLWQRRDRL
ncbi:FecCD family ABC transporter permease [Xanthobacter oligotrophicus]|uniref:FecCD family ABC transporter permease n=1 Tax=Xanthobacter oligotrophicus TaxID=2607286 RepID=UPI0011F14C7D|nr:iron ABC transporter permease [Xanthobacter oligotrophicus]MCG5233689.1 iron ABC transporter permease [Xanthobacter oligotrophicus]